jgi:hypothetical protein
MNISRTIRIPAEHGLFTGCMLMVQIGTPGASPATPLQQMTACTPFNAIRVLIALAEHAELRARNDLGKVMLQQVEFRLVVVQIYARAHIDAAVGSD